MAAVIEPQATHDASACDADKAQEVAEREAQEVAEREVTILKQPKLEVESENEGLAHSAACDESPKEKSAEIADAPTVLASPDLTETSAEAEAYSLVSISHAKTTECPQGHALKLLRAPAGTCDSCGNQVADGRVVMACRSCNWYLCTGCRPISACPAGHMLHVAAAVAGTCDGCQADMKEGEIVADCRMCNFYLCEGCQPALQSVAQESIRSEMQPSGKCALCKGSATSEDIRITYNGHAWQICASCKNRQAARHAPAGVAVAESSSEVIVESSPLPKCPEGYQCVPQIAQFGKRCGKCAGEIAPWTAVSRSAANDWHLCTDCHPIRQCPKGHKLEARPATAGACDGCQRRVAANQCVLDCRHCNWYLCGGCHLSVAQGGA